jgi:hypothetical protein
MTPGKSARAGRRTVRRGNGTSTFRPRGRGDGLQGLVNVDLPLFEGLYRGLDFDDREDRISGDDRRFIQDLSRTHATSVASFLGRQSGVGMAAS